MYKDKEAQKEADRERQRRYRALQKGVTSKGVTEEGVTFLGNPIKCPESVVLSDGQVWHPEPRYWNPIERDIEYLERKYPNKENRRENAIRYKEWSSGR